MKLLYAPQVQGLRAKIDLGLLLAPYSAADWKAHCDCPYLSLLVGQATAINFTRPFPS